MAGEKLPRIELKVGLEVLYSKSHDKLVYLDNRYIYIFSPGHGLFIPAYRLKASKKKIKQQLLDKGFIETTIPDIFGEALEDGVFTTPDDCLVEPDGTCPHGYPSWLIILGLI